MGSEDYYVCPIPKGKGVCSHKVPIRDAVKEPPETGDYIKGGGKHLKGKGVCSHKVKPLLCVFGLRVVHVSGLI
uniref:Uncharacterized protein n=1 Tax=Arundo donax TaxID=35708 RepID=A0A0A9DUL8_ARUDO